MKAHVELVGWINIVAGGFFTLLALLVCGILVFLAPVTQGVDLDVPRNFLALVTVSVGGLLLTLGIAPLIAGVGLLSHKAWARPLALIIAAISLFMFPVGTLVAIYIFWVLTNEAALAVLAT